MKQMKPAKRKRRKTCKSYITYKLGKASILGTISKPRKTSKNYYTCKIGGMSKKGKMGKTNRDDIIK